MIGPLPQSRPSSTQRQDQRGGLEDLARMPLLHVDYGEPAWTDWEQFLTDLGLDDVGHIPDAIRAYRQPAAEPWEPVEDLLMLLGERLTWPLPGPNGWVATSRPSRSIRT